MVASEYLTNIYDHADVYPTQSPEQRAKFYTGPVKNRKNGDQLFLKVVREGSPDSVSQDLETEATWNTQVQPHLQGSGIQVPQVQSHSHAFRWALFEQIHGKPITEKALEDYIERIAKLCARVSGFPLEREPNGLSGWIKNRFHKFTEPRQDAQVARQTRQLILDIADSIRDFELQAGMVHGDINLKNLLVGDQLGQNIGLVDSEFGTLFDKPEWDKPRFHDAAYFYHLLYCQYERPDLAERFKKAFEKEMRNETDYQHDTFEKEFSLSVLERTLSMGNHYPWRTDANKPIEDGRRLNPGPYVELIDRSLAIITR